MKSWWVEVNEARVFATVSSAEYWSIFRLRMPDQRIEVLTSSLGGDRVRLSCDSGEDARWLEGHLVSHGGLPATSVKVVSVKHA